MHGAAIRDFKQTGTLIGVQITGERDGAYEAVDLGWRFRAGVLSVDFVVGDIDADMSQRPAFAARVHANGHTRTRAETRRQEAVGRQAFVGAPLGRGFIGQHMMRP